MIFFVCLKSSQISREGHDGTGNGQCQRAKLTPLNFFRPSYYAEIVPITPNRKCFRIFLTFGDGEATIFQRKM